MIVIWEFNCIFIISLSSKNLRKLFTLPKDGWLIKPKVREARHGVYRYAANFRPQEQFPHQNSR